MKIMTKEDFVDTIEELKRLDKKSENYNEDIREGVTNWYFDLVVKTLFRAFRIIHTDEIYNKVYSCVCDNDLSIDGLYNIFIETSEKDKDDY